MILVDSIYVNCGGALSLLSYLVEKLQERNVDFFLLADARCEDKFNNVPVEYRVASISERRNFYLKNKNHFSSVLCFGNVPPPVRMQVPVYTYFHNINMLTLSNCRDNKQKFLFWIKRLYIKWLKKNTNEWLVQTQNTADELIRNLKINRGKVALFPFYKLPAFETISGKKKDYIFVGDYSGSKGHDELLKAWELLHNKGIDLTLHLTVSQEEHFLNDLKKAIANGVKIVNHGFIPVNELAKLYLKCKATIYPSYNESFGLGLVEAMEAGCDVVASDLPYVYSICKPSVVFDPKSSESIADAVMKYEEGDCQDTALLVKDRVEELIQRITSH